MQKKSSAKTAAPRTKSRAKAKQELKEEAEYYSTPAPASRAKRGAAQGKKQARIAFNQIELTDRQYEFYNKLMSSEITFGYGAAGSSKTFTSCYAALKMLDRGDVERIYLTKPIQESGEKLGHLPGDISEKTDPYTESFYGNMEKLIDPMDLAALINEKKIEFKPLAYLRGVSLDNAVMILDEAQNCDFRQLQLYISRMGKNTKVFITGDVSQYDIEHNKVALPNYINMIQHIDGVSVHEFTKDDIVRNSILIQITDCYEKFKAEGKTTANKR